MRKRLYLAIFLMLLALPRVALAARYANSEKGFSFDPPPNWQPVSQGELERVRNYTEKLVPSGSKAPEVVCIFSGNSSYGFSPNVKVTIQPSSIFEKINPNSLSQYEKRIISEAKFGGGHFRTESKQIKQLGEQKAMLITGFLIMPQIADFEVWQEQVIFKSGSKFYNLTFSCLPYDVGSLKPTFEASINSFQAESSFPNLFKATSLVLVLLIGGVVGMRIIKTGNRRRLRHLATEPVLKGVYPNSTFNYKHVPCTLCERLINTREPQCPHCGAQNIYCEAGNGANITTNGALSAAPVPGAAASNGVANPSRLGRSPGVGRLTGKRSPEPRNSGSGRNAEKAPSRITPGGAGT